MKKLVFVALISACMTISCSYNKTTDSSEVDTVIVDSSSIDTICIEQ